MRSVIPDEHEQRLDEAATAVRQTIGAGPRPLTIVSGSGLAGLASAVSVEHRILLDSIPHMPRPTVAGHPGMLLVGTLGSLGALFFAGRLHLYEGFHPRDVVFPIGLARRLGGKILLVTNASGGVNPLLRPGDLMMITNHINLTFRNPLIGIHPEPKNLHEVLACNPLFFNALKGQREITWGNAPGTERPPNQQALKGRHGHFGVRGDEHPSAVRTNTVQGHPNRSRTPPGLPYDPDLCALLCQAAQAEKIDLKEGIYAAMLGPSYETKAEAAMLREMGADAVGMSTVPEVLAACSLGFRIVAVSCIANRVPVWGRVSKVTHDEVVEQMARATERLKRLIVRWVEMVEDDARG